MAHLGPEAVRVRFQGMVRRCADCGFDLAAGRVPVIPTAHYMMGGIMFERDCSTELAGLFVAGEDAGGVHGANRLGGNGVAESTVFGGIAGETMAAHARRKTAFAPADEAAVEAAVVAALAPLGRRAGNLPALRQRLADIMWRDVGVLRSTPGLERATRELAALAEEVAACGVASTERRFNRSWQEYLDLESLVLVSRAIAAAALARRESRGAHWREDFPASGDLSASRYTVVRLRDGDFTVTLERVSFDLVAPGCSLLHEPAA